MTTNRARDERTEYDPLASPEVEERDDATGAHLTPAWIDAFECQLVPHLPLRLSRFARTRLLLVARAGRKVDDYYVKELIQDAISDTWTGRVAWDPRAASLEHHLMRVVQSRTRHAREHAADHPHDALGDDTDASRRAEEDAATAATGAAPAETALYSKQILAQLRARLADDANALRIVDAIEAGAATRSEILEHSPMTLATYRYARERLRDAINTLADSTTVPTTPTKGH